MLPIYLLGVVSVLNLGIAFVVLQRSKTYRKTATLFAVSAVTVAFWALGDALLLSQSSEIALWWGRVLYLAAPVLTMYFLLLFAIRYPDDGRLGIRQVLAIGAPTLVVICLLVIGNDVLIEVRHIGESLNYISVPFGLYSLYSLIFAAYFLVISAIFLKKLRRAVGLKRAQIWYVFLGAFLSSLLAFITDLAFPLLGVGALIWMGPIFTIVYMISYTIAIARYRLFDLRRAAGRAVAYVLAMAVICLAYGLSVSLLREWVEVAVATRFDTNMYYIGLLVISLLIFPKVKQKFDVLTQSIFFRNDYDVQDTIDLYGSSLVSVIGKTAIMEVVTSLTKKIFVARKILFLLGERKSSAHDVLTSMLDNTKQDAMTTDEAAIIDKKLASQLRETGIELSLRLKTANTSIGWLLLGEKKNGAPYDRQDVRTINTVADQVAIALENASNYEKISVFNETLQAEVENATKELRQTNKKLHDLDESKDEFISMASHQLRTPLTTVKGYISMLLDGDVGKITPSQRKVLEEAFSSSQRMVYLISDFLNVSRLQNGKFELELRPVDLAEIVTQEVRQMEDAARSRRMTLEYDTPGDIPLISLDENKIRQVIMNFIDNAVYYSKPGDRIQVTLSKYNGYVSMKVIDHGIGVPASERHRLFAKFYRASNAKKQRPDGTGIGLFMARKVITAHEGSIIFETAEGKGSTFGFRLPLTSQD